MEIPFECFEYTLTTMKEGDGSQSKTTLVCADYDSDETMVDDSIPGSEEEEDELYLKRILINDDVFSTSAVSLCPKKTNVGEQSPEIHFISKLIPAARIETATKQVSNTPSDEEASQSLLRNWEKNSKPIFPLLKESCPCQPTMDHTGLCEDSQQLFDSSEIEMQENNGADESPKNSLLSAVIVIDVSCLEKQMETLPEKDLTERSTRSTPSLCNSFGWVPSDSSHLYNVKEQSITQETFQNFNEKSTLTKGDCKNVSRNDTSYSQTSLSLLELVKPASEVSKTAICDIEVRERQRISNNNDIANEQRPSAQAFKEQMNQQQVELSGSSESKEVQDNHLSKNSSQKTKQSQKARTKRNSFERSCRVCDDEQACPKASHLRKRKCNTSHPEEHEKEQKSTESTTATEIVLRKSSRLEIHRNARSSGKRKKRTNSTNRIGGQEKTSNCTAPIQIASIQLNRKEGERTLLEKACTRKEVVTVESTQHSTTSKRFRNIHKRNLMGETLLHKACRKGELELVIALLEAGINVNHEDNAGWRAIHEASCKGNSEIILALIQAGADVNCKGLDGILPLHDAVYCNHFKAAEILMKFGADPYEKDDEMENAFDKCCSDKMMEILTSYCGSVDTPREHVIANQNEPDLRIESNQVSRSNVCRTEEILSTLHDIESKQKKLLSSELEASVDAENCVEELNEIQNVLNNIANLQKIERNTLEKKYRASADSFKQGILRDKIAKAASQKKTLLQVVRNQKEVTLKIMAHQQTRRSNTNNGETSSTLHHCDMSPERSQIIALCAVNERLGAKTANGSTMTTKIPGVHRVPDTESNQSQRTISRCISSSEISRTAEVPTVSLMSEAQHSSNLTSKQKHTGLEDGPLSFDSVSSIINDHFESIAAGSKSQHLFPVNIRLDNMKNRNISVEKTRPQKPAKKHQTKDTDQPLQRPNYEEAIQQVDDVLEYWKPQNKAIAQASDIYQNNVCQSTSERQQKCVETERKKRKFPFKKLMKLGKLKPGVDVLSFQLQDSIHKATLLCDGQVTDCSGAVFQNPCHWVSAVLGNNISVTWKYTVDKVYYLGKKLSSLIEQKDFAKTIGEPDAEGRIAASPSYQPPGPTVLQVNEILLVDKSELFSRHIMEKYWEEFMNSDTQDF